MDRKFLVFTGILSAGMFGGVWLAMLPAGQSAATALNGIVYYPGCDAVRAVGKAPLNRGEPGFREEMDGDGDGVACEPYAGGAGSHHYGYSRRGVWRP